MALARERGLDTVYVPAIDAREATLLGGVRVMPVQTLRALHRECAQAAAQTDRRGLNLRGIVRRLCCVNSQCFVQ